MGLLSLLKRKPTAELSSAEDVQRARSRARQRLIGATVLVAVAVIGLPMLLDTAPRPVSADLPIEIPRKESAPPLPAPRAPTVPVERADGTPAEPSAAASAAASRPAARAELPPEVREETPSPPTKAAPPPPEPKPVAKPPVARPAPAADAARAEALLEGRAASTPAAEGRFVVQVGAFAEGSSARDARAKVEKLGLKTYTQVVETKDGKRIRVRVGPYAERAEADRAAAKLRASGLGGAVLTL